MSSKIRVTFEIEPDTGDYEVQYQNVSEPGQSIDLTRVMKIMKRVIGDHGSKAAQEDFVEFQ